MLIRHLRSGPIDRSWFLEELVTRNHHLPQMGTFTQSAGSSSCHFHRSKGNYSSAEYSR